MGSAEAAVVQRFLDGFNEGDLEKALACLHPEVVVKESGEPLPYAGTYIGPDGLSELVEILQRQGLHESFNSYDVLDAGDVVVSRIDIRLTHTSGRLADSRVVEIYTVKDGVIVDVDVFYKDPAPIAELAALTMNTDQSH